MEKIAFLWRGTGRPIYWRMIFIAMAALVFLLVLAALRAARGKKLLPLALIVPTMGAGAVYAARLVHWYCRTEDYAGLSAALGDLWTGGFSLAGAFAGALAAAGLLRLVRIITDLPAFLDDTAAAASVSVAVGRLGDYFGGIDHGRMILADEAWHKLPWASPVYHAVSGTYEWRFATFMFHSCWSALIFLAVLPGLLRSLKEGGSGRDGRVFIKFMTLYCLGEILLDSTRYDALFLRSNGFVSMEQILCCAVLLAMFACTCLRQIRARGFSRREALCLLGFLAGLGLAGYMEYYVQRHGGAYAAAYSAMAAGLAFTYASLRILGRQGGKAPAITDE